MSKFKINDYLTEEEKKVIEESDNKNKEKKGREIQILSLKDKPASAMIAETLVKVLRNDGDSFRELPEEEEGIFSQVRVIAKEDINDSPTQAAAFAREADVLIIPNDGFRTFEEEFFLNNAELDNKPIYHSVESYIKNNLPKPKIEGSDVVKVEINDVALEDHCGLGLKNEDEHPILQEHKGYRLNEIVEYGEREFTIKYLDEYVVMIHACNHEGKGLPVDYHVVRYTDLKKKERTE